MRYAQEPSRARHLLVLAATAAVLVALVALIALGVKVATGNGEDQTSSRTTNGSAGTGAGSSPNAGEWETDTDAGLPIAAASQDGHPVGFPRTDDGAAAMVVELNRAQIGLDYDDAVTTIGTYAAETDQVFFKHLATSAIVERRKALGVPVDVGSDGAEVLAPAGYAQTPVGFQVEEYGPDRYLVSVINEVTATTANGQLERSAYVGQQLVAWNPEIQRGTADGGEVSGDWELVEPSAEDRDRLLATDLPATAPLGTPEFEQAGWTPLLESSTNSSSSSPNSPSSSGVSDKSADEQ